MHLSLTAEIDADEPEVGATCHPQFSIRQTRQIVGDLFVPNPWIYWTDFLASIGVGGLGFHMVRRLEPWTLHQFGWFVVAVFGLYRAALFIHELTHLKRGTFTVFRAAWNVLCGIPMLMPSFLYYTHMAHHARKHYGTPEDGEYLPLATSPVREILLYMLQPLIVPPLAMLRFLVLSPVAWICPTARRWIQQRASSMVMDPAYVRPIPGPRELFIWRLQESGCFVLCAMVAAGLLAGVLPWRLMLEVYLVAVSVLVVNSLRTLGAHRFRHRGEEISFLDQLLDSVNYPHHPLTAELWAPVGLRFHGLHHLFPSMPYHNLGIAHRRLMKELPADSPYRRTESPSLWRTLVELWTAARQAEKSASGAAR